MSLTRELEAALAGILDGFAVPTFNLPPAETPAALATLPTPEPDPQPEQPATKRRRSSRAPFRRWDKVDTVTITHNTEKGGVEIRFPGKPPQGVIDALKYQGFRWNPADGCWWKRYSDAAMRAAQQIESLYRATRAVKLPAFPA